jgi:hypothetical protein
MLGLSNIAFSSSYCIMTNNNMIMSTSSELENTWKKAVIPDTSPEFPRKSEERHKEPVMLGSQWATIRTQGLQSMKKQRCSLDSNIW